MPSGWKTVRIDELGDVKSGRQRSARITAGEHRPYLRVANVFDDLIDTSDVLTMPFTDTEYKVFRLELGDVLVNEGQSRELVGRSATYCGHPPNCCFQNTLIRFRPGPETVPGFPQLIFQNLWQTGVFSSIATKTTSIAHLGVERFASLRVSLPLPEEQRAIVTALSLWKKGIDTLNALLIARLRLKEGLMQQLLTGKQRFRGCVDEWRTVHLRDVIEECSERNCGRYPTDLVKAVTKSDGIIPMRERTIATDIDRYQIVRTDWFAYNPMRLNIGSIARWSGTSEVLVSPDYVVFRCRTDDHDEPLIDAAFLDHLRRSHLWKRFITPAGNGSVRVRIYFADLGRLRFRLPPIREQRRISDLLDTANREIDLLGQELHALTEQRNGLLYKLLTAHVRVKL